MSDFKKQIHDMFDHIWDCDINHPIFEDTVGELMDAVIQCYNNLPSVQPEIVRCKDCKHRHTGDCPMYHIEWVEYDDDGYIDIDDIEYDNTEDDGFCYKGS